MANAVGSFDSLCSQAFPPNDHVNQRLLSSSNFFYTVFPLSVLKGSRVCDPKICHFGILIIFSWLILRNSTPGRNPENPEVTPLKKKTIQFVKAISITVSSLSALSKEKAGTEPANPPSPGFQCLAWWHPPVTDSPSSSVAS